jgi:ABC-2 type transport system ATP-binding protein
VTSSNDIILRCEGLSKIYTEIKALDTLNLEIRRGHIFGYIGHNGAGKTTTIRILAGLLKPSHGKATIAGIDVDSGRGKIKSVVGYMPDSFGVYDQMRVWEYLDFFGAAFKMPRKKRKDRIEYVMEITQSTYMRDRFVDTLSHGMKQRIGIARTLMHDPQVLLLDEPANGLDPVARVQMRQLLRRLADDGKTLLVSSHILPELAAVCDEVGIIHQGVLKAAGPIQSVLARISSDRLVEMKVIEKYAAAKEFILADKRCNHVDDSGSAENLLRFRYSGDDLALAAVLQAMVTAGMKPVSFRDIPPSLEDAYLAISGISVTGSATGEEVVEDQLAAEQAAGLVAQSGGKP